MATKIPVRWALQHLTGLFSCKSFQITCSKRPLRRIDISGRQGSIPRTSTLIGRISQNLNLLRRHITLRQQEHLICISIKGHIDNNDRMARRAALYEYIADLKALYGRCFQFFGKR